MTSPRLMQRDRRTRRDQFLCSSFGLRVHVFEERFVHSGLADYVFLAGPIAEVEQRQRSLQKGNSALASESVGFLQIGQRCFICRGYRKMAGAMR